MAKVLRRINYLDIAINRCFGAWKLSYNATQWLKYRGMTDANFKNWIEYKDRHNPILIECIRELGKEASSMSNCGPESCIQIHTLTNENVYFIQDWDGMEKVWTPSTCPWITAPYNRVYEYYVDV